MKKLTDKERLDWLEREEYQVLKYPWDWGVTGSWFGAKLYCSKSLRGAIDKAIRAEQKRKEGKP